MYDFREILESKMAENGWTQEEIASRCGMQRQALFRVMENPTVGTLQRISDGIGVDVLTLWRVGNANV